MVHHWHVVEIIYLIGIVIAHRKKKPFFKVFKVPGKIFMTTVKQKFKKKE